MALELNRMQGKESEISSIKLLTIPEIAKILNIGRTKAYELAKMKEIPVVKIGTSLRVPEKDLIDWIKKRIER